MMKAREAKSSNGFLHFRIPISVLALRQLSVIGQRFSPARTHSPCSDLARSHDVIGLVALPCISVPNSSSENAVLERPHGSLFLSGHDSDRRRWHCSSVLNKRTQCSLLSAVTVRLDRSANRDR